MPELRSSRAGRRWFGLGPHGLSVQGDSKALELTERLIAPPFRVVHGEQFGGWTLRIEPTDDDLSIPSMERLAALDITSDRWHVVNHTAQTVEIVITDRDLPIVALRSDLVGRRATLRVAAGDEAAQRWPSRLVKLFVGARLLADGWTSQHAAAFSAAGQGVLCVAGGGQGKSTLAFIATTVFGASFVSDDITFVASTSEGVMMIGWPKRIGIPLVALQASTFQLPACLRRPTLPPTSSGRGERIALDPDEHRSAFGVTYVSGPVPVTGVVQIRTDPSIARPEVELLSNAEQRAIVPRLAATPLQQKVLIDPLGVFGRAYPTGEVSAPCLDGLPMVRLVAPTNLVGAAQEAWSKLAEYLPLPPIPKVHNDRI